MTESNSIPTSLREIGEYLQKIHKGQLIELTTLGPEGTSADYASQVLVNAMENDRIITTSFKKDFNDVMKSVLDGNSDYALVPSAYTKATTFHWHPNLALNGCYVCNTPRYGIAAQTPANLSGPITLAAMPEVENLFMQLAPEDVRNRLEKVISADSTSHAAALVRAQKADVAVCNELGLRRNDLAWLWSREGVPMLWMLFSRK